MLGLIVACERASDFPARPEPISWFAMPLQPVNGTVDGTAYKIDLPPMPPPQLVGSAEAVYSQGDLLVHVAVYQESQPYTETLIGDSFEGSPVDNLQAREDGYSFTYTGGGGAFRYLHVDDGALSCKATAIPGADRTRKLIAICDSLVATSRLANTFNYPPGMSPRELRAASCKIAINHVQTIESAALKTKKRKTKAERDAELARDAQIMADYARRQSVCEKQRWSDTVKSCLVAVEKADEAASCVPAW